MNSGKGTREKDDDSAAGTQMAYSLAFGGARPKTNTRSRIRVNGGEQPSGGSSQYQQDNSRDMGYANQDPDTLHGSPMYRRRRNFHRTNSSDSVLMVLNNSDQGEKGPTGHIGLNENLNEERGRRERGLPLDHSSTPSWDFYSKDASVPPLIGTTSLQHHTNKVNSMTNSNMSVNDAKSEDLSELDNLETIEDDCYIYTYKGGTAYLSADLPTSFFRLDSGSDGESLPGKIHRVEHLSDNLGLME